MAKLVGINGFKRSGKGETAQILNEIWPNPEEIVYGVGFADKLKMLGALGMGLTGAPRDLIADMDRAKEDWTFHVDDGNLGTFHDFSGREYLQNLGNHARNLFGDAFWVNQVLPEPVEHVPGMEWEDHKLQNALALQLMYPGVAVVAITDLRYENEACRVKELGGEIWEVTRPGVESDGHASEQPLPEQLIDVKIINDGTLEDLRFAVNLAMEATLADA